MTPDVFRAQPPMDDDAAPTGRYLVARHWTRWAVQDGSWNPPKTQSLHDTETDANAAANRLNTPTPPRPHPQQPTLFEPQEA